MLKVNHVTLEFKSKNFPFVTHTKQTRNTAIRSVKDLLHADRLYGNMKKIQVLI